MASIIPDSGDRGVEASAFSIRAISASDRSAIRTDVALLVSALFLQRFSLPFGNTFLQLDLTAIGLILLLQFLREKLLIQYDRLLSFLGFTLATTSSLLLNFKSTMLTSYLLFTVFNSLFILTRPSSANQYKRTLRIFQFFVMILSCLGVAQFLAQFLIDSNKLIHFYGIFPDFLLQTSQVDRNPFSGSHFRSNAIFLYEASSLSQITALGILIEVIEFRRLTYLLVMTLGFLVSYSGTGTMLLLIFLPLAGLRHGKAGLPALLVAVFMLGLFATGIIDLSVFLDRTGEFENTHTSGFVRFVSPFYLTVKLFYNATLQELLIGNGPGMAKYFNDLWYGGGNLQTWFKTIYEYGIIGSFIFCCFLVSCLRQSRCPSLVISAIIFAYVFLQGSLIIMIVLCTLSARQPRRRIDESMQGPSPHVVAAETV